VQNKVQYDAILFDFDGTLVDSEPVHFEAWREVLAPFKIELTWDEYARNCIGVSDRAMILRLAAELGLSFEELYATYPAKKEIVRSKLLANPPMPAATKALIPTLTQVPIAVVTSSYELEVLPILDTLGLSHLFQTMVFGDQVQKLKPHPEPYLTAAQRLGVHNPLVFEDSDAGLASARAAGFTAIQVPHPDDLAGLLQLT
jgi:beta-phosphoglucomutase